MKASKTPPKYDPNGEITPFQVKRIMQNCSYQVEKLIVALRGIVKSRFK